MSKPQEGYLLIADITGYTNYLSKSELDHAQDILTTLLELLVSHTRPPLTISRLAGDAVISYGFRDNFFQGQTFMETLEDTYTDFRKAIETMTLNNTCRCNACANVSKLDLKFFVNYGTFAIQRISDHDELVGNDVNLIHRLLKNSVVEKTGFKAYTLYTDAALNQLGFKGMDKSMKPHAESYDHLGKVKVWIQDMYPAWQKKHDSTHVEIAPEQIIIDIGSDISLQPEIVWDYLAEMKYRKLLFGSDKQEIINRKNGRIDTDSVYLCYHGDRIIKQTILEWQPFKRIVTKDVIPIPLPGITYCIFEYRLEPIKKGTHFTLIGGKAKGPLPGRMMVDTMMSAWPKKGKKYLQDFKKQIEKDHSVHSVMLNKAAPEISENIVKEATYDSLPTSKKK